MSIDYDKLLTDTTSGIAQAEANTRLKEDGYDGEIDLTDAPKTALEMTAAEHPAARANEFRSKSAFEKLVSSIEGGYHGLQKGEAASEALQNLAWSEVGYGGLTVDEDMDDDSRAQIESLLSKDTQANRTFKQKALNRAMDAANRYKELEQKDHLYAAPEGVSSAIKAAEGKGFWGGLSAAAGELWEKDPLGNLVYLAGSSFGAMLPYITQSAALGGIGSLGALRAMGATSGIRSAITAGVMGSGSYANESGQFVLDELERRGLDPKDVESYRNLFLNDYESMQRKRGARATVVSSFDAIGGAAAMTKLNPKEGYRALRNALEGASKNSAVKETAEHAAMVKRGLAKADTPAKAPVPKDTYGDALANMASQTALQGVLGGAGEYFGSKAAGEDPNSADVLFEVLGEFTSAPVEVAALSATAYSDYRQEVVAAQTARLGQDTLRKMTQATEAVAAQVQDKESFQQWAERIGEDKSVLAFAQDLVDNGQIEEIRKTDPEFAERIEKAAEDKQTIEVPVSKIVEIAADNRKLADDIVYDSRVEVDGMTPRQADEFEKNGRAEAEQKFDQILTKTRLPKEHAKEAREVSAELTEALVADGMSENYARTTAKVWQAYLVQRSRLLGVSPKAIARAMGWRVKKHGGLRDQAESSGLSQESDSALYQKRTKAEPQKTVKVYKLMRIMRDENGQVKRDANGQPLLYALFIDSATPIEIGSWYDAESPEMRVLQTLPTGIHLCDNASDETMTFAEYVAAHPEVKGRANRTRPGKADIKWATDHGMRFMEIKDASSSDAKRASKRYGDARRYYNLGLNGPGAVTPYALRAGWHAASAPSMRQIAVRNSVTGAMDIRADDMVWVEGEMPADIDYQTEADATADGDLATKMPTDGFYRFYTNADKSKRKAGLDWMIGGAFKPTRVISDNEARAEIDRQNAELGAEIPYDYGREGGREFNAETMEYDAPVAFAQSAVGVSNDQNVASEGNTSNQNGGLNPLEQYVANNPDKKEAVAELKEVVKLKSQREVAIEKRGPNQREYQYAQQAQVLSAAQKAGLNLEDLKDPVTRQFLVDVIVDEAKTALEDTPSALGWYNEKVRKCLAVAGLIFPELDRYSPDFDPNAEFAFIYATAITSNGLKVSQNLPAAIEAYSEYRDKGKFKLVGFGTAMKAINQSLSSFPDLLKNFGGIDEMRRFFMTNWTVKQLGLMGFPIGGEGTTEMVRGAAVLGPKIGNGFFSNLYGLYSALTMDRWFMRTIGRWTGTVYADTSANVEKGLSKLKQYIKELRENKEDLKKANEYFGVDFSTELTDEELLSITEKWALKWVPSKTREEHESLFGEAKAKTQRSVMNAVGKYVTDGKARVEQLAPKGSQQRADIRSIFNEALEIIHAHDDMRALSMADLQALLWYAEKRLYESTHAYTNVNTANTDYAEDEQPDYATVMVAAARDRGVNEDLIQSALKRVDDEIAEERKNGSEAAQRYEDLDGRAKQQVLERSVLGNNRRSMGPNGGSQQSQSRHRVYKREESKASERDRRDSSGSSGSDSEGSRRVLGRNKLNRALGKEVEVLARWSPGSALKSGLVEITKAKIGSSGDGATSFNEIVPNEAGVEKYIELITKAKASQKFGACVEVKGADELKNCRLFLSDNGKSGFALKDGDDIVSVFSEKGSASGNATMQCAIAAGGRRLDCFNTILPRFYGRHGFVPVGRLKFNRDYAPEGWDYELFGKFNNGVPDIVFMAFDPTAPIVNEPDIGGVKYVADYDDGTNEQKQFIANLKNEIDDFRSIVMGASNSTDASFFQTAYHGTGAKFDAFSLAHVGEGTGMSTHGYGLYFTADREVADGYRQKVADNGGRIYEVDVPEDDVLLNETIPLSEHPAQVQEAIRKLFREEYGKSVPSHWNGRMIYQEIILLEEGYTDPDSVPDDYWMTMDFDELAGDSRLASERLRSIGIKGLIFEGDDGDKGFVVWDEGSITMVDTGALDQSVRGSYNPVNSANANRGTAGLIELMQSADRSTFLHESAHAWLDADTRLALALVEKRRRGEELTPGEQAFLTNLGGFFRWGQSEGVIDLGVGTDIDSICAGVEAWSHLTVKQQRGMHELFAEGFESYLMGGEAPSNDLIPLFHQFAQWLKAIYAKMTTAPRPISPEVRKLYDQLFVSEQEAADAEARAGLTKMFADTDTDIMSDAERAEYDRLSAEAAMETQGVVARAMSGVMRTYAKIREGTRAVLMKLHGDRVALVEADLMKEPRHIARKILTTGYVAKDGRTMATKLSRQALLDAGIDKKTVSLLKRRGLVADVGVTPEILAGMCGHKNPLTLIGELVETKDVNREACEIVAAQVRQETGMDPDTYSTLRADLAAHNATRSRVLTIEHNVIARKLGKRQLLVGAAREYALAKVGAMKVADITPAIYQRDERRCAREAESAFRKGDYERCLEMKRAQILNHEMARAALEVKDVMTKGQRRVKRAMKSKVIYPAYQQLLCFVASIHGIEGRKSVRAIDETTALSIAASLETDGTPIDGISPSTDSLPALLIRKDIDDMTADEVKMLFEGLQQLEKIGRDRLTIIKDGIKQRVQDAVEDGIATLERTAFENKRFPKHNQRVPLTQKEKAFDNLQRFFYAHIKIATWCRIFDGGEEGFFTKTFIQTANERAGWEEEQRVRVATLVRDIMRPVFKNHKMFEDDKVRIGNRMMSKGERIAAALNMGNASNFQRLVDGDRSQWTPQAISDLQESLTVDDWRAVQMIWSLFESFRPLIAEKEKRVYGVEPQWIEFTPITIRAKGGKEITLEGGYYPVVYDPRASNIADVHQEAAAIEQSMKGAWQSATTRRSFTKSRVAEVHDRPLRLDLSALYSGLDDVIHDLAWHEWLIATHRLLSGVSTDGGLRSTIKEFYGYHVAKSFEEWRQAIALGDRAEMDGTTRKIFHWAAGNVGLTAMGFSVTSALSQITGIGYIVPRCGTTHTLAALKDFLKHPKNIRRAINANSTLMRNRHISATKQVSEIRNVLEKGKENWIQKYAYFMLLAVQSVVDAVAWQAGYRKAMSEGKKEEDAIREADQVVIDTQSSGRINDLSAIERNEYLAPFTVFYSWANAALNQSYAVAKSETSKPKKFAKLLYMGVLMPIIEGLFRECMKIDGDDDDDEEKDWIDSALLLPAGKVIEYHCGLLVGVREVANAAGSVASGDMVWKYGGPAGVRGISTVVDLGNAVQDPVSWSSFNTLVDFLGLTKGLPSTQIKKTVKGVRAIESGQVEGFDAMLAPMFGFSGKIEE